MSYGVTESGFNVKPFEVIVEEIQDSIRTKLGNDIVFVPEDPLQEIVDSFAEREQNLWQIALDIYNSQYISKASGVSLDYAVEMVNIRRNQAIKAIISEQAFWGNIGENVDIGTRVSTSLDSSLEWEVLEAGTLGSGIDNIWNIECSQYPDAGYFELTALDQKTVQLPFDSTNTDVENALNALTGVFNCTVSDGVLPILFSVEFEKQDLELGVIDNTTFLGLPNAITTDVVQEGEYQAILQVVATVVGEQPANIYSVKEITSQVATNLTDTLNLVVGDSGTNIESDDDLRTRALSGYQIVKYSTYDGILSGLLDNDNLESARIVENDTSDPLFEGTPEEIPPHSFKTFVFPIQTLTSEQEQDIGQDIFNRKPLGIQSTGDVSISAVDSQGNEHEVGFDYADEIEIFLDLDLTTGSDFPTDGIQGLKDQIIAWGNELGPGENVVVNGSNSICGQVSLMPGIATYVLRLGTSANPTGTSNIVIDDGTVSGKVEVSKWISANINIIEV